MADSERVRLQRVEMTIDAMRRAFNTNHVAYSSAISALDGHFSVLRAVLNDIHRGEVTTDAEGNIDWKTYYDWYNQYIEKQKQDSAAASTAAGKGDVEVVEKIPAEQVFGGDYGSGD